MCFVFYYSMLTTINLKLCYFSPKGEVTDFKYSGLWVKSSVQHIFPAFVV